MKNVHRMIVTVFSLSVANVFAFLTPAHSQEALSLELGKNIEREITSDQMRLYQFALSADQFMPVVVEHSVAYFHHRPTTRAVRRTEQDPVSQQQQVQKQEAEEFRRAEEKKQAQQRQQDQLAEEQRKRLVTGPLSEAERRILAANNAYKQGEILCASGVEKDIRAGVAQYLYALSIWRT